MKKAVYKKVDEKIIKEVIHHEESIDELGNVIEAYDEVVDKVVPIMGTVYEEMTEEEIEALPKVESIPQMPTDAERIEALEMAMLELLGVIAND